MKSEKIIEIKALAKDIDVRINLFEGFMPKDTAIYNGELLYWRQMVNIYGLLSDCDRVQIKANKNLFEMMLRYNLIDRDEYYLVKRFWNNASNLRKWFCHNNDPTLFYKKLQEDNIKKYLKVVFKTATNIPVRIEEVSPKGWDLLVADIEEKTGDYLDIMLKGFQSWKKSSFTADLINEWIDIFSDALSSDGELMSNVLAEIAEYNIRNQCLHNVRATQLGKNYKKALESGGFSSTNIRQELINYPNANRSNKEILIDSIQKSGLI